MLRRTKLFQLITVLVGAVCTLLGTVALADPPGRVGRVTLTQGSVSIFHDREDGWQKAYVNFPVTSQNSLFTDFDSRAEVRIGGTAIRLGELSQIDIQQLDFDLIHLHVVKGTVAVTVRHFDRNDRYIITTPEGRFAIRNNGRYRITVDGQRAESSLAVFRGSARFEEASGRNLQVEPSRRLVVVGQDGHLTDSFQDNITYTSFDDWSQQRDDRWSAPRNTRYVSTYVTGYEDLDEHGYWSSEPSYGAVWYPRTTEYGWAPFRHGRWQWIRPWGWTWVDAAPWGFAVSHYGRWAYINGRWGWCPGNYVARPIWAPAVVGFYGGGNWAAGIRGPLIGWYPLAPWEPYNPWYTNNPTYIRNINNVTIVNNNTTIINNYNRQNGTTTVLRETFGSGAPVNANVQRVAGETAWQQVPTVTNNFQAALPTRPRSKPLEAPVVATSAPGSYASQPSAALPQNTGGRLTEQQPSRPLAEQGARTVAPVAPAAPSAVGAPSQPAQPSIFTQPQPVPPPSAAPRAKPLEVVPAQQASAAPSRVVGEMARPTDPNFERTYRMRKDDSRIIDSQRDNRRNSGVAIGADGERTVVQSKRIERAQRADGDRVSGQRASESPRVESVGKPRHDAKPSAEFKEKPSPRLQEHQR